MTQRFKDVYSKNDAKPSYVAIGIVPRDGGWCVVRLLMRGGQVVEDSLTEPDMLSITREKFKLVAAKEVLSQ